MKKTTSQAGIDAIKRHEGFSVLPYKDVIGLWTVGYGHQLFSEEQKNRMYFRDKKPVAISEEHAEELLRQDLKIAENAVNGFVKIPLEQYEFDALVSFVFNLGGKKFKDSTMLKLLNKNADRKEIAEEFPRWRYANFRIIKGLENRRKAEAAMFLNQPTFSESVA